MVVVKCLLELYRREHALPLPATAEQEDNTNNNR